MLLSTVYCISAYLCDDLIFLRFNCSKCAFLGQSHILKCTHVNDNMNFHYNKARGVFDQKMSSILNYLKRKVPQDVGEFQQNHCHQSENALLTKTYHVT